MITCHLTIIPPPLVASDGLKLTNKQNQNKTNYIYLQYLWRLGLNDEV